MSFGSGGFGGFGSNNQQQSTFGGFGANNNNNTGSGFGSNSNSGSIFGQSNNTGGGMFGQNNTGSAFGSGGGFGSNNTQTSFGSKPFGSTGGGLFGGGSTSSTTFGGFGSTSNNTTSGFGGGSSSGGLFGQNKTGFGTTQTGTGTGSLFGGGNNTGGGFGTNTTGGFGASTSGGFGASPSNAPNNGTATTPFQPFQEKEAGSANGQAQYQTITFQQPYQNYSLEELRMADYNQGRRYGNQNGQAGAFGQSTGFGGFGSNTNTNTTTGFGSNNNTGGGLFGNSNNTNAGFGSNTNTAFGSNNNTSGGGLFGQNKPGGLFGSTTATQTGTGGGLFGGASNTNTTGTFGSGGTGFGSSTGGGLFGQNNQTQNKPAFGGFGNTASNTTTTPFGGSSLGQSNTGGGLFGQQNTAPGTTGFGQNTQTPNTGGGLFGNTGGAFGQNQQNQNQNQAGGGLFGGGFGQNNQNNQQKPGGLFGGSTTNTGGGLFGNTNQQQQQQQQPATGGLFGQAKPAGGLFGSSTTQQPGTTGGLFGNTGGTTSQTGGLFGGLNTQNTQQNTGGGLFGSNANQQKPGGLFGTSTTNNTGGGLFGNLGQNNTNASSTLGSSLFGGQNQQQQNQQPANNSLFGASGSSLLQTSMNTNPYGNDALFVGLATPTQSPGPLATPLSSSQKNRKNAILPQHKLNPSQSTRLLTPQGKRNGGYGFTYSTYGTPTSASSQSSPLNGSLFSSGSLSRSLGKSLSTSNLRNSFTPDTSILAPGAFSTTGRSFGSGSLKKLNINRSINSRPALFDEGSPAKRVSFASPSLENSLTNGPTTNGSSSSALVVREESNDRSPGGSSATANGDTANGTSSRPEMQQVNGQELTPVPENGALAPRTSASLNVQNGQVVDPSAGQYYSEPNLDALKRMSKYDLQHVSNFVVGRDKIGKIEFNMGKPVDLSDTPLDKLFGDIILLNHRNATVYGESCSVPKPPQGSGLNHPSRVTLGNSWPRGGRPGKKDQKHLERLKRVNNTIFEEYRPDTGEWVFRVPHFSTYGFDYDDDEDESSPLSAVPDTPAQLGNSQMTGTPQEDSFISPSQASQSSPDDTFDFKKGMRRRANVPGQFGDEAAYEEDEEMEDTQGESFLGERSVGSLDGQQDYTESESGSVQDQDMADSVSRPIRTTEQSVAKETDLFKDSLKPKSILKTSQLLRPSQGTPSKGTLVFDDNWANALQRTISPKKQDRPALRESQGDALRERDGNVTKLAQSVGGQEAKTMMDRMDLMNSLFGETDKRKDLVSKRAGYGLQYPYAKRPKTSLDLDQLSDSDKEFHSCSKPHFSETGVLIYMGKNLESSNQDIYSLRRDSIAGGQKDIHFKKLPTFVDAVPSTLDLQKQHTKITSIGNVPHGKLRVEPYQLDFEAMANAVTLGTEAGTHEQQAWQLLALLFDDNEQCPPEISQEEFQKQRDRYRKEQLSEFWRSLVYKDAEEHAQAAPTAEEKAIAYLSCNSVADACHALLEGFDLRLATMVAQIGGDDATRRDMTSQIEEWRRMDVLAEMDESVRALYELIAGNCAQSDGKAGGGRENRAPTFNISSRFNLDWRRAFGLRLWYGIMADEPIEMAVAQFADALHFGKEDVRPKPWFINQAAHLGWDDPNNDNREDLLWGILKLYASPKMDLPTNIEDVLAPENVSGHPLNARLSFQLFQLFKSRRDDAQESDERVIDMPTVRSTDNPRSSLMSTASTVDKDDQAEDPLIELGDKLTLTYAASLHTPEHWTTAVWVYTHLSSPAMRAHYIQSLLNQFSSTYSLADTDHTYKYLTHELSIPNTWLHTAAALQAKSEGDALRQAMHLIKADELDEAHEVLCRSVGPESVISRDYDALRELMGGFIPTPTNSPISDYGHELGHARVKVGKTKEPVRGWSHGGGIYFDYIELLDLTGQRSAYRVDEELNYSINNLLGQLQKALEVVARDRWEGCGLEERVALTEIAGTVAGLVAKNKSSERSRVLKLPLTEDLWLKHSVDLATTYYRNVMASK